MLDAEGFVEEAGTIEELDEVFGQLATCGRLVVECTWLLHVVVYRDSGASRMPNEVCSQVRDSSPGLLDAWHDHVDFCTSQDPVICERDEAVIAR